MLGISKTKDLVFGAKILDAKQALDIGESFYFPFLSLESLWSFFYPLGLVDYVSDADISAADHASEVARGILPNGMGFFFSF